MKKTVSLILLACLIISLFSCGPTYEPVESTEEEARVVMNLTFDGELYEIRYELYRALFLTYKSEVDGGDASVWSGDDADEYIERINGLIISRAAQIFAALHEAEKIGFDPYSREVENKITEYVRVSVEGGSFGEKLIEGEGSYEEYLEALREMYLNYSVQTLIIRYYLAVAALEEYFLGKEDDVFEEGGEYAFDEEDVLEYYFGDECASYMQIFLYSHAFDLTRVEEIRNSVASQSTKKAVAEYMTNFSTAGYEEIYDGSVLGLYELDRSYHAALTDAVFALSPGETSEPVKVGHGDDEGYYIVYRFDPGDSYFEDHYDLVENSFLLNMLGKRLAECEGALVSSVFNGEHYDDIIHHEISMD